jgi:hypothetical protein
MVIADFFKFAIEEFALHKVRDEGFNQYPPASGIVLADFAKFTSEDFPPFEVRAQSSRTFPSLRGLGQARNGGLYPPSGRLWAKSLRNIKSAMEDSARLRHSLCGLFQVRNRGISSITNLAESAKIFTALGQSLPSQTTCGWGQDPGRECDKTRERFAHTSP